MSSDLLIKVEDVSKKFCRNLKQSLWYGLKDLVGEAVGRDGNRAHLRPGEFWAVDGVSFEIRRGECLGLIGRNGAGKTTLLKMLNGLIRPDRGRIEMRGRVGALIALGAGFNPILSGRENIYVNGSVLGLSKKEIDDKIDDIIDFSELHDFIDSPVQSYSSGMQVRLGFAIATALHPDILLLDEVLAVGDVAFRTKCFNRVQEILETAAVIFVSHQMSHVGRICSKGLLMQMGKMKLYGADLASVIHGYESENVKDGIRIDTKEAVISSLSVSDDANPELVEVNIRLQVFKEGRRFSLTLGIQDSNHTFIAATRSRTSGIIYIADGNEMDIRFQIDTKIFAPGKYYLEIEVLGEPDDTIIARSIAERHFVIRGVTDAPVPFSPKVYWKGFQR